MGGVRPLRTADAVTPSSRRRRVVSLALYVVAYAVIFGAGVYLCRELVRAGPGRQHAPRTRSGRHAGASAFGRRRSRIMALDLVPIWAVILALAVFMYVLLDGFDLGVGILLPFAPPATSRDAHDELRGADLGRQRDVARSRRRRAVRRVSARVRDRDPGGLLPDPVHADRADLPRRRVRVPASRRTQPVLWDHSFFGGSLIATFAQGVVLGTYVQGFPVRDSRSRGSARLGARRFRCWTGVGLIVGYALLGATLAGDEDEGEVQAWARARARIALVGVVAFIAMVSIWTPLSDPRIAERWFSWPNIAYLAPLPIVTAALAVWLWISLDKAREVSPFFAAIGLFMMCFLGLGISIWPNIVPYSITLWNASGSPRSQAFLLIGTLFLLPIIIVYTAWSYDVFRGKVKADAGYH